MICMHYSMDLDLSIDFAVLKDQTSDRLFEGQYFNFDVQKKL